MRPHPRLNSIFLLAVLGIVISGAITNTIHAQSLTDRIGASQSRITEIEKEIAQYEGELIKTGKEKDTLNNALKILEINKKRLESESSLTETRIVNTNLVILSLGVQIEDHDNTIGRRSQALASSLRQLQASLDDTWQEIVLSVNSLSETADLAYTQERLQASLRLDMDRLANARQKLDSNKQAEERAKSELLALKTRLSDQKKILLENQREKSAILVETKNKESNYKSLLARKLAEKELVERELRAFELQLKSDLDFTKLPKPGSGVLSWPLSKIVVTQNFGNTEFSRSSLSPYNGAGHNGIDMGAPIGTPVLSARSGLVRTTGDTDTGCPGGSYGKWILIDHNNGLSTLYAHLSLVRVSDGEQVSPHDVIGYSGNTGYSTGPHLHFTVYATEGVQIRQLTKPGGTPSKCPPMPVSPLSGYLNPMLYL